MVRRYFAVQHEHVLSGFLLLVPFLCGQFEDHDLERHPRFVRRVRDGEWLVLEDEGPGVTSPASGSECS
jgi:hypothetical protein